MQNQLEIIEFLLEAKKNTYAANTGQITSSRPASYDLSYEEGEYLYIDSYLGTHLFSGQEAVFKEGCPIWAMNYSGRVLSDNFQSKFLKKALMHPTQNLPYRGPNFFQEGDNTYVFQVTGDFSWFKGRELIFYKNELVYELELHGGEVVDKHFD